MNNHPIVNIMREKLLFPMNQYYVNRIKLDYPSYKYIYVSKLYKTNESIR